MKKLRGRHSIEAWGARLGVAKVGADIEDFSVWTPELQARCVGDGKIAKAVWHFLQPDGYSPQAMELEHRVNAICNQIEADGVPFDDAAAARLERQWSAECSELKALLQSQFPGMNPGSRAQIAKQLEARGWIPEERTKKTGQPKIDDELLESIPQLYPEFAGLARFHILRRRIAQLSKGKKAWRKHVGENGRIHGGIVHIGTRHSRAAHSGPNLAQVPNPKRGTPFATECRSLFQAPAGWVFVTADQATLQDRAFAHYLTEFDGGAYAKAFLSGVDQHWKGAAILDLVAKETARDKQNRAHEIAREGAKAFRYAFLFGCQGKTAGRIINKIVRNLQHVDPGGALQRKFFAGATRPSEDALRRVGGRALDKFEAGTPGLRQLRQHLEDHARRHGWLPGLDGRRVPVRALRSTLNFIVTSAEAIICKRWLVQVHDELRARFHYGWDGDVVIPLWIHDELACCCRAGIAAEVGEIMVRHAKKAGEFYGLKVLLDADFKIGRSWAGELQAPDNAPIIDETTFLPTPSAPPQKADQPSTVPAHQINQGTTPERDFPRTTVGVAATEPPTTPKAEAAPSPATGTPGAELPHAGAEFLAGMFGGSTEHATFVCSLLNNENRVDGRADERFVTTRDKGAVAAFVRKWDLPKRGIYYCVSTLVPNARRRSKETLAELNCLHCDLDFKNLEAAPNEVRRALRELEHPPSIVVFSGHGLHCLWLFKEGLEATPANIAQVEELLRRLTEYLGADPQAAECARLLRLPGSHNTKHGGQIEVVVEIFEPWQRYALDDLAAWLEAAPAPRLRRRTESKGNGGGGDENPFITAGRGFKPPIDVETRLAAMRYQGVGDSAIHLTQLSVSAALINRGTPVDEVVAILLAATRTAAGDEGGTWNWEREEHELRRMCRTWIEKKHPEGDGAPKGAFGAPTSDSGPPLFDPWAEFNAPKFPIDALPPVLREFVPAQSSVIGADISAMAMAALAALSGAIDHRFALKMMRHGNWWAHPRLWVLLVGVPSSMKTPAINAATRPLERYQKQRMKAHQAAVKEHKATGGGPEDAPPPLIRYVAWDSTVEALGDILSRSPRGILVKRDEVAGWIGSMERYHNGRISSDRAFWLQAYNGGPYITDRIKRGEIAIENNSVSLLSGTQPGRLAEIQGLTSDGLLQRLLPALMNPGAPPQDAPADDAAYDALTCTLVETAPTRLYMTDTAIERMQRLRDHLHSCASACDSLADGFQAFAIKLRDVAGSLALILHLATDPERNPTMPVEEDTVAAAERVVCDFILPHALEFYNVGNKQERLRRLASFILTCGKTRIVASDLTAYIWDMRGLTLKELNDRMSPLEAGGWVEPETHISFSNKAWRVAPAVAVRFAARQKAESERKALFAKIIVKNADARRTENESNEEAPS